MARNNPQTFPFLSSLLRSKRKMSCIVMTDCSMPVISVMAVTLRLPSDRRVTWIRRLTADAVCSRIARSGRFRFAMATIVSSRYSASRGLFAWMVVKLPS